MYLNAQNLAEFSIRITGLHDDTLEFHTVAAKGDDAQPHGLFIPLSGNFDDLFLAIHHGAIAAVWEAEHPVPKYTPNLFPIYYTKNIGKDVHLLLNHYLKKIGQEDEVKVMSNILFFEQNRKQTEFSAFENKEMMQAWSRLAEEYRGVRRG